MFGVSSEAKKRASLFSQTKKSIIGEGPKRIDGEKQHTRG